jgi:hypothetical protein
VVQDIIPQHSVSVQHSGNASSKVVEAHINDTQTTAPSKASWDLTFQLVLSNSYPRQCHQPCKFGWNSATQITVQQVKCCQLREVTNFCRNSTDLVLLCVEE